MFDSSHQHNIFVPDCIITRKHHVSSIHGNVHAITCCRAILFSIVTYSVNVTVRNWLIVQLHDTHTILCLFIFDIIQ